MSELPTGNCVNVASDQCLVYGRITVFFIWLSLLMLRNRLCGNSSGLIHFELHHNRLNVVVLIDVDLLMLPIALDIPAEIGEDTVEIIPPEHLLNLIFHLPIKALVSNDGEIIDIRNDCGHQWALMLKHAPISVDTWWLKSNRDHKILYSPVPNI